MAAHVHIKLVGGLYSRVQLLPGDGLCQTAWPVQRAGVAAGAWLLARTLYPAFTVTFTLRVIGEDDKDAEEVPKSFCITLATEEDTLSLRVVDPSSGQLLLEGTSPAASPATFTLPVNDEDGDYGDIVPKRLHLTPTLQGGVAALGIDDGHGSMQLDVYRDCNAVAPEAAVAIVGGGTHTLVCGPQVGMQRHWRWERQRAVEAVWQRREWEERSWEKAAKLAFMGTVQAACQQAVGGGQPLSLHARAVLVSHHGQAQEVHGLLLSATAAALVVEAAHPVQQSHVQAALDKAAFVAGVAQEARGEGWAWMLQGITSAVPVLASSCFPPAVAALCQARGVGVVQPAPCGGGYGYVYTPPALARHLPVRRALHTLACALRAAL